MSASLLYHKIVVVSMFLSPADSAAVDFSSSLAGYPVARVKSLPTTKKAPRLRCFRWRSCKEDFAERFSRNAGRSVAPLQLRLLPFLALRSSVDKNQVAATRKISLFPPPAAVDFSPSLAGYPVARVKSRPPTKKAPRLRCFRWRRRRDLNSRAG